MGKYTEFHKRSIDQRDEFWAEQSALIDWQTPPKQICDFSRPPFANWFVGGKTNLLQRFDRTFDREIGKAFAKETLGKSLANRQMLVLKQLAREKMHESELVNAALSKEFGIDPAAQYRYDDVTRAIIKLATPPGGKARSAQTAPPAASKTAASLPAGKTGSGTRR